jgi:uncharacterized protein YaaW (UPF0174 family)
MSWYELTTGVAHLFALGGPVMWVLLGVCLLLWLLMVVRLDR